MKKSSFSTKHYLTNTFAVIASLLCCLGTAKAQGVSANAIYGDFGGYWTSSTGSLQTTNDSNNLLAFTVTDTGVTTTYSTGVNNATLDANSVSYVASDFAAFPISNSVFTTPNALLGVPKNWTGTVQNGSASDIILNRNDLPNTYLSDGEQGLALGTVIFNTPGGSSFDYDLSVLSSGAVTDNIPDIIVTQMGDPSSTQDRFKFIDSSGNTVGSEISIDFSGVPAVGRQDYAFYFVDTSTGAGSTAPYSGFRDTRLLSFKLSEFGITPANYTQATQFVHTFSGGTDIAFVAYNRSSFAANPTDFAITTTANNTCPSNATTLTVTVTNTGNDALNFAVDAPIPAGLTFGTKTPSVGSYDETTGKWQINTLPNGQSATLTLTATTPGTPANFTFSASLGETLQTDSNPTNNRSTVDVFDSDCDGVQNTDDLDDDNDGIPDLLECPSLATSTLDWSNNTWTAGSLSNNYTVSGESISVNVTDTSGALLTSPPSPYTTPTVGAFYQGDQASIDESLVFATLLATLGTTNNVSVTLDLGTAGVGLDNVQFSLFDVDGEVDPRFLRQEKLTIAGELNGVAVNPVIAPQGTQTVTGNVVRGFQPAPTAGTNSEQGVVDVAFASAVDKVTITFEIESSLPSFSPTSTPGFSLYDIRFNRICDTDGDGIPNHLDLDSDNDGCVDALEGASTTIDESNLTTASGSVSVGTGSSASNQNLGNGVPTTGANIGIPSIAGLGQGISSSQVAAQMSITQQPTNQSATVGDTVSFDVTDTAYQTTIFNAGVPNYTAQTAATGVTYQWFKSTDSGSTWTAVAAPAGTVEDLSFTSVSYADAGQYKRTMTCDQNPCAVETSVATLAINRPPVATDDSTTVDEDTTATGNVITDTTADSDADNDTLTVTQFVVNGTAVTVNPSTGGTTTITNVGDITINADGSYTFTPISNYNGNVPAITYTISDGNGGTDTADLDITVTAVNDAPIANDDSGSTPEDTTLTVTAANGLLNNDSDVDGDTLTVNSATISINGNPVTITIGTQTALTGFGNITINTDGSYTFVPDANFNGSVPPITYTISDGNGGTDTATLTISVGDVSDAPVANPDTATMPEDTAVNGSLLTNDSDDDGDTLTVTQITINGTNSPVPANGNTTQTIANVGEIVVNSDGTYTFTPAPNYTGTVPSIGYTISDGDSNTADATSTLTITVTPVNDMPVAEDANVNVTEDTPANVPLRGTDAEDPETALTYTIISIPPASQATLTYTDANGATQPITANTSLTAAEAATVTITPANNYAGAIDSLTYTVTDTDNATSAVATITFNNNDVNDPPTANDASINPVKNTPIDLPLTGQDVDGNITAVTLTSVPPSNQGIIVYDDDGNPSTAPVMVPLNTPLTPAQVATVQFVPTSGYTGNVNPVVFTVTDDDDAVSAPATVTVAPIAAITVSAPDSTTDTTPTITGTTSLPTGTTITVTVTDSAGNPQTLTTTVQANGTYSVTPTTPLAEGDFTAVSTATDSNGNTVTATDSGSIIASSVPTPSVNTQTTTDTTPIITGSVSSALTNGQTLSVSINGATYPVIPDANGNWSIDLGTATPTSGSLIPLEAGKQYEVNAVISDTNGNPLSRDNSALELTIIASVDNQPVKQIPSSSLWGLFLMLILLIRLSHMRLS